MSNMDYPCGDRLKAYRLGVCKHCKDMCKDKVVEDVEYKVIDTGPVIKYIEYKGHIIGLVNITEQYVEVFYPKYRKFTGRNLNRAAKKAALYLKKHFKDEIDEEETDNELCNY